MFIHYSPHSQTHTQTNDNDDGKSTKNAKDNGCFLSAPCCQIEC